MKVTNIKPAEYKRNVWYFRSILTTIKEMLEPSFWAHVSAKLAPGDKIEVFAQDGEFYVEFMVLASKHAWVRVAILQEHVFNKKTEEDGKYKVKWTGKTKWRVIRLSDGEVLQSGLESKELAQEWLDKHKAE